MKPTPRSPRSSRLPVSIARSAIALLVLLVASVVTLVATAGELPEDRLEDALVAQFELLAMDPGNADLHSDLGNLLELSGRTDEAADSYREAIALDPSHVSAHYNLALLQHSRGELREARHLYETVVEGSPKHSWAHYQLGRLAEGRGKRDDAVAHYARAFTLNSDLAFADTNPHVLDNTLITEALLSTETVVESDDAPRIYKQPTRIGSILAPRPAAPKTAPSPASPSTPATVTTAEGGFGGVTTPQDEPGGATSRATREGRLPRTRSARPPGGSPQPRVRRSDDESDDRSLNGEDLRDLGRVNQAEDSGGSAAGVGRRRQNISAPALPRAGATAPAPRLPEPDLTPVPDTERRSTGNGGGRFRPGSRSSAQLNLEIVPLEGGQQARRGRRS